MKSPSIFILTISVLVSMAACNSNGSRKTISIGPKTVYLSAKRDGQIKDSLLVYGIGSLMSDDNNLYVAHKGSPHLVVLNADLNYVTSCANNGDGPGETGKIETMALNDSAILAFDSKHQVFNYYSKNGKYLKSIRHPMNTTFITRFALSNNNIYYYNISDTCTVERSSLNEPYTTTAFSRELYPIEYRSREEKFANNFRHLLKYNDRLIEIGESQPELHLYNTDGSLKMSFDLRTLDIIGDEYDYNQNRRKIKPSYRAKSLIIIRDAKIYNNSLYLLVLQHIKDMPTCNTIVKMKLAQDTVSFENVYRLLPSEQIKNPKNYPWYYAFSMLKGKTIAYEATLDEFHTYQIQ